MNLNQHKQQASAYALPSLVWSSQLGTPAVEEVLKEGRWLRMVGCPLHSLPTQVPWLNQQPLKAQFLNSLKVGSSSRGRGDHTNLDTIMPLHRFTVTGCRC
jgi:hypothetical protein